MLLMPKRDWQWRYNETHQVLSVSLGDDMEFLSPYKLKSLIPDAKQPMEFSVEHAKFYIDLVDRLSKTLSLTDAQLVQIALNATAAHFLLKPQMPKSWFFNVSHQCVYSDVGKLFQLTSTEHSVVAMVIESGLQASLVMIMSAECRLTESKSLKQFETIKVMHDRLAPLPVVSHRVNAA
ncbi:cell division protein ZapC [Shewanella sairae]|uniref:Cell division protein ZapC n=1 Tax=Shewanella sairae TaxID=190310 RepID=A0ABQ4PJT8_9GAMM|nr:cell division protein ZapC [Shewanella sairae]MCL1130296.1 cell division protein ZapC [Shewanella sairae]GIU48059.1 cell division protein ZapC [Shewanella sairae]